MERSVQEKKFTYSKHEYTLPGSSRFENLLYTSPPTFKKRFFYYPENNTSQARLETRALLTLAYVNYLTTAETDRLISSDKKTQLLKLWKSHSFWPKPNETPSVRGTQPQKAEHAPAPLGPAHSTYASLVNGGSSWRSTAGEPPLRPSVAGLDLSTRPFPLASTYGGFSEGNGSTRLNKVPGLKTEDGAEWPPQRPGTADPERLAALTRRQDGQQLPGPAVAGSAWRAAVEAPRSTGLTHTKPGALLSDQLTATRGSPQRKEESALEAEASDAARSSEATSKDNADGTSVTGTRLPAAGVSWRLPEAPCGTDKVEDVTFKSYFDVFCQVNPSAVGNPPWDILIKGFKGYIVKHFGRDSLRHVSTAITASELRDKIPSDILQGHVRQLLVDACGSASSLPRADLHEQQAQKRNRAAMDDATNSPPSKHSRTGTNAAAASIPDATAERSVLSSVPPAPLASNGHALPGSSKGPVSRAYSPSFPQLPSDVVESWRAGQRSSAIRAQQVAAPAEAILQNPAGGTLDQENPAFSSISEPVGLGAGPGIGGHRVQETLSSRGGALGRAGATNGTSFRQSASSEMRPSSTAPGLPATVYGKASRPPPMNAASPGLRNAGKPSLGSLLLAEKFDKSAFRSSVRLEGHLQEIAAELQRVEGFLQYRQDLPEQVGNLVVMKSLIRRALGELLEPAGGVAVAAMSLAACVEEMVELVDRLPPLVAGQGLMDDGLGRSVLAIKYLAQSASKETETVYGVVDS